MNRWSEIMLLSLVHSYIVLLLQEATILNRPRTWLNRFQIVAELIRCSMCLGFWVAMALARGHLMMWLAIASMGELITRARKRWLPCEGCQMKQQDGWTVKQ